MAVGYYATVVRGRRVGWLAGPFDTRAIAEAHVPDARREACAIDPWCDFDGFGVTRLERNGPLPAGVLNGRLARHKGIVI